MDKLQHIHAMEFYPAINDNRLDCDKDYFTGVYIGQNGSNCTL